MSRIAIEYKPGGILPAGVNLGIKLTESVDVAGLIKSAVTEAVAVAVKTTLDVTVVYPVGALGASVQVTGDNGFSQAITQSTRFEDILPGIYTIVATTVAGYTARVFTSPVALLEGESRCAFVVYDVNNTGGGGAAGIAIKFTGDIPPGASAIVTDSGSFSQNITSSQFVTTPAGSYAVQAPITNSGGSNYAATPLNNPAVVTTSVVPFALQWYSIGTDTAVIIIKYSAEVALAMADGHYVLSVFGFDAGVNPVGSPFAFSFDAVPYNAGGDTFNLTVNPILYDVYLKYSSTDGTLTIPLNMENTYYPIFGVTNQTVTYPIA